MTVTDASTPFYTDWWTMFWTGASFFAIVFTGFVALYALRRAAVERRDDRATALIERYNTSKENYTAYSALMQFSDPDIDRAFVHASLVPPAKRNGHDNFRIVEKDDPTNFLIKPLLTPSNILVAARDILNWLTECSMLYNRDLASRDLVLEVCALTAIRYVYIFDSIWDDLQKEMAIDMRCIRKLALLGQWYARRSLQPTQYDKLLNYCFTAF